MGHTIGKAGVTVEARFRNESTGFSPGTLILVCMAGELVEGVDYYMEGALVVFTEAYLSKRGYCCESGCRHCPYGFDALKRSDRPVDEDREEEDRS